jgi:carbon-monoxide dehydrogenase medium subunit
MPLATLVLGATFHVESATAGRRQVAADEMFVSFFTNALAPDEMITWISVPAIRPDQGWGFVEYAHQHGDYGLAGAGCLLTLRPDGTVGSVRAAVLNVADRPLLFEGDDAVGREPSEQLWRDLAEEWGQHTEPAGDDADYARRLCSVALTETLADATRRANAQRGGCDDVN